MRAHEDTGNAPVPARAMTELMNGRRRKHSHVQEKMPRIFSCWGVVCIQHLNLHVYNKHQNEWLQQEVHF